jgi:hypothetical protein
MLSLALVTGIQQIDKPPVMYQFVTLMVLRAFQTEQRVRPNVPLSPTQDIFDQPIGSLFKSKWLIGNRSSYMFIRVVCHPKPCMYV